ncbi:MAG: cryptochrome/photolyase family protein, partial [Cytophagia bacterium]|nr:cryptochrome/photolyase family protein [Cytophagia bacterium]
WFMELFIDAYDWVMVPNVYGMSQYADGGFITTKPYVSGSNYVLKMSDYKKGEWCTVWDGLYWRFLFKHQEIFKKNQRMSMMINLVNKMDKDKLEAHLKVADNFLKKLK